ncbi:hypothetical protein DFH07DRAFT_757428, partial [Mycena maculata]
AEKYGSGLVESWRSDMEGILIFAGLFSASLTAFIIESYSTLIPDSGDATVVLLTQISRQLAASANGTTFEITPHVSFKPPATSVVCNILSIMVSSGSRCTQWWRLYLCSFTYHYSCSSRAWWHSSSPSILPSPFWWALSWPS